MLAAALRAPDPAVSVLRVPEGGALPPGHPAFGKTAGTKAAVAFVCRRGICSLPIADAASLARALRTRG
jgi:hypothetical protein